MRQSGVSKDSRFHILWLNLLECVILDVASIHGQFQLSNMMCPLLSPPLPYTPTHPSCSSSPSLVFSVENFSLYYCISPRENTVNNTNREEEERRGLLPPRCPASSILVHLSLLVLILEASMATEAEGDESITKTPTMQEREHREEGRGRVGWP